MRNGWNDFVLDFRIPHRKGTSENIEVACPFCTDDPSYHMGLSLIDSAWACWRNAEHRGKNPTRLMRALLRISSAESINVAREYFLTFRTKSTRRFEYGTSPEPVAVPKEFIEFNSKFPQMERQFKSFLEDSRQFDCDWIVERYSLRWCITGEYAYRVVIPFKSRLGGWFTWAARAISPELKERYKAPNKSESLHKPNDFLFDTDNLNGGNLLVVVEGFFDAARITSCFIPGVNATALFGTVMMPQQLTRLMEIAPKYKHIAIGLDERKDAIKLKEQISWYVPQTQTSFITAPRKDWGETPINECKKELLNVV